MRAFLAYVVGIIVMAVVFIQGLIFLGDGAGILIYVLFFATLGLGGAIIKLMLGEKLFSDDD